MKAEFVEPNNNGNNDETPNNSNSMFAKLHHSHHPHPHQQQRPQKFPVQPLAHRPPPPPPPHFLPAPTSEDDDSLSSPIATTAAAAAAVNSPSSSAARKRDSGDGASIEVARRPRGRPPGSKNKPKPPLVIARDSDPVMSPYILEISGGADVVEAVSQFSRRRNVGLCVLTGSGTVANVSLRQPSATPGATVTFHGRFDILSLSAAILPPTSTSSSAHQQQLLSAAANGGSFTISLAGPQGQIVGGMVSGPLLAAGTVYIIAASFDSPSYHRLPAEGAEAGAGSSVSAGNEERSPPPRSGDGGGGGGHAAAAAVEMSMFSGHLQSDVMWGPGGGGGGGPQQPPY